MKPQFQIKVGMYWVQVSETGDIITIQVKKNY